MWITRGTTNEVYADAVQTIVDMGSKVIIERPDAVDSNTIELHPATIEVTTPHQHLVTAYGRPVNVAFALAEVLWILGGRSDVEMLEGYNSTISRFSDDSVRFNAAYGDRLRHSFGVDQLTDVIRTLRDDPSSRQATMIISNPVDDKGWDRFPNMTDTGGEWKYAKHQTKDRACNLLSHLMIRDDKLDWMQILRSNDAMWGMPYNFMQWTHVMKYVAATLDVDMGTYTHIVDSLHIYSHHFGEAALVKPFDLYDIFTGGHSDDFYTGDEVINTCLREELIMRTTNHAWEPPSDLTDRVGGYWRDVLNVLAAHRAYKDGRDQDAFELLVAGDPIYGTAQARFYYQNRWYKDEHMGLVDRIADSTQGSIVYDWITTRIEDSNDTA